MKNLGEVGELGGEASPPPPPPVDETQDSEVKS